MRLQAISDAFRAYGTKIGAPEWASYDYGETARFVEFFVTTAKDLVETHLQEYGQPPADAWPSIADAVLRRIKNAVSEEPPLPQMVHTYPWRPSELFGRQDFLESMLVMISSHFPKPEGESIKAEPTIALPAASSQSASVGAGSIVASPRVEQDLEYLLAGKSWVQVLTAAKYLNKTPDHIRRLVRQKKLASLGHGRPIKVSTAALRKYNLE